MANASMSSSLRLKGQGPIWLVGLGHGATHWIAGTFYVLLPFLTKDLGLSYTEAGLLVSVLHVSSFFANFGSGALVDMTGRKVVFQVLSLTVGAAARPGIHSWMMDLAPSDMRGSATSVLFGTQAALSVAVPVVGGAVADTWGLPEVFYVIAAVMLVANAIVVFLPAPKTTRKT